MNPIEAKQLEILKAQQSHQATVMAEQLEHQRKTQAAELEFQLTRLDTVKIENQAQRAMLEKISDPVLRKAELEHAVAKRDAAIIERKAMEIVRENVKNQQDSMRLPTIPKPTKGN